ncbi:hypothetical protein [Gryllotalpicola ginsengisoli]|uniref:hypothetical protein n=1 Tax=Gryllotalpicola ginsengisoli TaxID=444608 RepID=UPI0003B60AFF|nr:hypothetical protein [Gryllotalpicola ginsengisoli]
MKKPLAAAAVLAAGLALAGCTSSPSHDASSATPSASTSVHITSYTQVHDLNTAIIWGMTITPDTPNALSEIDHTGKLLKKYADASTKLTSAQKSQIDSRVAQSQSAVADSNTTNAGGYLFTAASTALSYLTGK